MAMAVIYVQINPSSMHSRWTSLVEHNKTRGISTHMTPMKLHAPLRMDHGVKASALERISFLMWSNNLPYAKLLRPHPLHYINKLGIIPQVFARRMFYLDSLPLIRSPPRLRWLEQFHPSPASEVN